ncbi:hypothetical protein CI102_8920 [Trichoderma harzianum]|nr:hypothetical protein CI102_8920 [Trichoderma harzianum]
MMPRRPSKYPVPAERPAGTSSMRAVVVPNPQLHQSLDDKPTEQRNCELDVPSTRPCTVTTLFAVHSRNSCIGFAARLYQTGALHCSGPGQGGGCCPKRAEEESFPQIFAVHACTPCTTTTTGQAVQNLSRAALERNPAMIETRQEDPDFSHLFFSSTP